MSSSKPVNSDKLMSEGIAVINSLKNLGLLDAVLERAEQAHQPARAASSAGGGMSDACKRRLSHSDDDEITEAAIRCEVEEAMMEHAIAQFNGDQSPIAPGSSSFSVVSEPSGYPQQQLPPGFNSLAEWGKTLCELPKVKKMYLSYAELYQKAQKGDTEIAQYLVWCKDYRGTSARTIDFGKYISAMDESTGPKTYYPGSHYVRRLK